MTVTRKIEVDESTARALEDRAAERGVSLADFVAELVRAEDAAEMSAIEELDRRWAAVEAGGAVVPHEDVVAWLATWGTQAYRPWKRR